MSIKLYWLDGEMTQRSAKIDIIEDDLLNEEVKMQDRNWPTELEAVFTELAEDTKSWDIDSESIEDFMNKANAELGLLLNQITPENLHKDLFDDFSDVKECQVQLPSLKVDTAKYDNCCRPR